MSHTKYSSYFQPENNVYKAVLLLLANLFSTIAYAVMFSSLELYLTQHLNFSDSFAETIMGVFLALNYGLNLFGSYLGGRYISYRLLFIFGGSLQIISCIALVFIHQVNSLYFILSLFLVSVGIMTPCINMMLLQQYKHNSITREKAFLWNYAGMNIGFTLGFSLSGYFEVTKNFHNMFLYSLLANIVTLLIIFIGWNQLKDITTPLAKQKRHLKIDTKNYYSRLILAFVMVFMTIFIINFLVTRSLITQNILLFMAICMFIFFIFKIINTKSISESKKTKAFILLAIANVIFWSIYQLVPTGLVFFIDHDVDKHIGKFTLTPQFFNIVNAVIIVLGGFLFPLFFKKIRGKFIFDVPLQFCLALSCMGFSLITLLIGIIFHQQNGYISLWWVLICYSMQSIGELLIAPIGNSVIGTLATDDMQGPMMGTWMLLSGIAAIIAGKASSTFTPKQKVISTSVSINQFFHMFLVMTITALFAAIAIFLTRKFLRNLIQQVN